jgi:hypothetical protein
MYLTNRSVCTTFFCAPMSITILLVHYLGVTESNPQQSSVPVHCIPGALACWATAVTLVCTTLKCSTVKATQLTLYCRNGTVVLGIFENCPYLDYSPIRVEVPRGARWLCVYSWTDSADTNRNNKSHSRGQLLVSGVARLLPRTGLVCVFLWRRYVTFPSKNVPPLSNFISEKHMHED